MSCNVGDFVACPAVQEGLNSQFNGLSGVYHEANPLLEWIVSPQNTQNFLQNQIDVGNGHIRQVELRYESRFLESEVSSSALIDCAGGNKTCDASHLYSIDTTVGASKTWTVDLVDLIERCEDDETYMVNQISKAIDVVERKINTDVWTQAALLNGKFATTGTTTAIEGATKNTDGVYIGDLIEKIRYQYMQMDFMGTPVVFGGSELFSQYWAAMQATCCNSTLGYDLGNLLATQRILPFFDRKAEAALGTDKMLGMAPGSLQLLTYNKFKGAKGIRVIDTETVKAGTITSPRSGVTYDYFASFVCDVWKFQVSLAYDLVTLPSDLFQTGDRMSGVNWVTNFKIKN